MKRSVQEQVASISLLNMAGNGTRVLLAFVTSVLASRILGKDDFGGFTLIFSYTTFLNYLLTLGFDLSLPYYIARFEVEGQFTQVKRILKVSLAASAIGSTFVLFACTLIAKPLLNYHNLTQLLIPAFFFLYQTLFGAWSSIFSGFLRGIKVFFPTIIRDQLLFPVLHLCGLIIFAGHLRGGVLGYSIGYSLASIISFMYLAILVRKELKIYLQNSAKNLDRENKSSQRLEPIKQSWSGWLRFSLPLALSNALEPLMVTTTIIYTGWYLGTEEVAVYQAGLRLTLFSQFFAIAVIPIFSPFIAATLVTKDRFQIKSQYQQVIYWSSKWATLVTFFLATVADYVLKIFGEGFADQSAINCLRVILIGTTIEAFFVTTKNSLIMGGHTKINIVNYLIAMATSFVTAQMLIPSYHLLGAAVAFSIGYFILNTLRVLEFVAIYQIWPFNWRQIRNLTILCTFLAVIAWSMHSIGLAGLSRLVVAGGVFTTGLVISFWKDRQLFLGRFVGGRLGEDKVSSSTTKEDTEMISHIRKRAEMADLN